MRKPQSSEWTKLGDVAPAKRITEERVDPKHIPEDIDTSAMVLVSGEFEVVSDDGAPTKEELASARPPRLAPKLFVVALAMLAGGGVLAQRSVPKFDAELQSIVAAMRPAPVPSPATPAAAIPPAPSVASTPVAMTVTSSATMTIVPKMRAPTPRMHETSAPPPEKPTKKATAHAHAKAKAKPTRTTHRH